MRLLALASFVVAAGWLLFFGEDSQADLIDFETGFSRMDPVDAVPTVSNRVTFSTAGTDNAPPFVAEVGTMPKDAFETRIDGVLRGDTPQDGNPGIYFLTDGAGNKNNYLFDLARPVSQFGVDLYDYVGDGGAKPTDFATLRAYSDSGRTNEVATAQWVVPQLRPADGLAVPLAVSAPSIVALTLEFSTFDRGTGIDNIRFVTVPEPSAITLIATGFAGILFCGWHRQRRPSPPLRRDG